MIVLIVVLRDDCANGGDDDGIDGGGDGGHGEGNRVENVVMVVRGGDGDCNGRW